MAVAEATQTEKKECEEYDLKVSLPEGFPDNDEYREMLTASLTHTSKAYGLVVVLCPCLCWRWRPPARERASPEKSLY